MFSYSLISGNKLARSGLNPMMVLCCFPGEHFKQSAYSLDKYSKKFLSVKSLKHFKSSFAYKHSVCRSDGKFMWLAARGGKSAISLLHGRFILPVYFHCMCNQALYLPAWSTLSFKLPPVTYFFSCNSLILGHPEVSPMWMFLRQGCKPYGRNNTLVHDYGKAHCTFFLLFFLSALMTVRKLDCKSYTLVFSLGKEVEK